VLLTKQTDTPARVVEVKIDASVAIAAPPVAPTPPPVQIQKPAIATPTPTPTPHTHHDKHPQHVAVVEPEPPKPVEPTPTPPPPPEPIVATLIAPTPVEPPKPTRTPVVAATAVTKLSGELPVLHGDHDGDVLVKMCIDDGGKVTSAKVVKTSPDMPSDLVGALQRWSYKPYLKDGKPQPVCFALSLRVVVKNEN
jgi:Gram-negative bacterial TonB protein C-terminal